MNNDTLTIQGLSKHFGDVAVLCDIDATLSAGRVTAFVGPNGAGKTTLFHAITGDLKPDSGQVLFRNTDITGMPPWKIARQGLGKMFQDVRIFDNLSIRENVLLALHDHPSQTPWAALFSARFRRRFAPQLMEEADHWLEKAGVQPPYDRLAGDLSFGNKKLLALARLMAGEFSLLLLDEPTSGVSPAMIERISGLISELCESGVTVALIEHNFTFVSEIADYTYLLRQGAIHDGGKTEAVLNKQENREILIGL